MNNTEKKPEISLRELKKARAKLALYEAGMELIGEKLFKEVLLEDLCRRAEISKVTFFKFFRQKEDLLVYFMRVWLTERMIELAHEPKTGFQAVRHILRHVAEGAKTKPGLMLSLIGFLSESKMHPCMPVLSEAEVRLLFPEDEAIGAQDPNMFTLFTLCMREAQEAGELRPGLSVEMAVQALCTIFYGAFLSAHLVGAKDLMSYYDAHLALLKA
jgi:AcrR family transcriptional regulator